jgi:hypothetical protein
MYVRGCTRKGRIGADAIIVFGRIAGDDVTW